MKTSRRLLSVLALAAALGAAGSPAHAVLKARGPVSPLNGYPTWYQDTNSLALTLCLDQTPITPGVAGPTACVLTPPFDPDPAVAVPNLPADRGGRVGPVLPITPDKAVTPISDTTFPDESFYFMASNGGLVSPGGVISLTLYEAAVEAGFAAAVVDGGQAAFTRVRIRADVTVTGTYTVTHPYGIETFNVTAIDPGAPEINFTNDVPGLVPGQFDVAVTGGVGFGPPFVGPTFLTRADGTFFIHPVTGDRYIGDNATAVPVRGGLNGINSVTITGGGDTLTFSDFVLMGKVIGMEVAPSPAAVTTTVGTPAPTTFTVTNLTGVPITIPAGNIVVANNANNPNDFTLSTLNDTCTGVSLPVATPPAGCSFQVLFNPDVTVNPALSTVATRTATVNITATADPPAGPASSPPPVSVNVTGTAQYPLTLNAVGTGTVTNADGNPAPTVINAGATQVYSVSPAAGNLALVKVNGVRQPVINGVVSIPNIGAPQTTAVTFLRAGNVDQLGGVDPAIEDALRALKIAVGIGPAPTDEELATADVGPLVSGAPRQNGKVDVTDVMAILRRAIGLQPLW